MLFVYYVVPETKGKTPRVILEDLIGKEKIDRSYNELK